MYVCMYVCMYICIYVYYSEKELIYKLLGYFELYQIFMCQIVLIFSRYISIIIIIETFWSTCTVTEITLLNG